MEAGLPDSIQTIPSYALYNPISGVPDFPPGVPAPREQRMSWGGIKNVYSADKQSGLVVVPNPKRIARPLDAMVTDGTIEFDGEGEYWSVVHELGARTTPLIFNVSTIANEWSNSPYFVNMHPIASEIQTALGVKPPGFRDENNSWAMNNIPVLIDGDFHAGADIDSLNARIAHFTAMTGRILFRYAPGEVEYGVNGMWWQHNSFQNSTNLYPDESNPIEGTVCAGLIKTTAAGYMSRTTSEHEMVRALGVLGNATNPSGGITNTPPEPFNSFDAMIIEWILRDRIATESGQNHARLSEMRSVLP